MSDPSWDATNTNIRWSLTSGQADDDGRKEMLEALATGSPNSFGHFRGGFMKTQRSDSQINARAIFDVCFNQDPKRVYNIGRAINQQPPI